MVFLKVFALILVGANAHMPPMPTKEVFWIRHGESKMNVNPVANVSTIVQRIFGLKDAVLTSKGEKDGDGISESLDKIKAEGTPAGLAAKLLIDAINDNNDTGSRFRDHTIE